MITQHPFRLIGLKEIDLTSEFHSMLDSALECIVICGYSFTPPTNSTSILKRVIDSKAKAKHCILPIDLFRSKDVNRKTAVMLIDNGVSVSIEARNHSKWLMTDKEIYFGSANFSKFSIEKRIEAVAIGEFLSGDPLRKDFSNFTISSMARMSSNANKNRIRGLIVKNQKLIRRSKVFVKRFNPSIKKVVATLSKINDVQSSIREVLSNCYWLLDDKCYSELTRSSASYLELVNKIGKSGNKLLQNYETPAHQDVKNYNNLCDQFLQIIDEYPIIAEQLMQQQSEIPAFSVKNRSLSKSNVKIIKSVM